MGTSNSENDDTRVDQPLNRQSASQDPGPGANDRPGFDLGGSVNDKTAGTGLGLGEDAAEDAVARRLPGRRPAGETGVEPASDTPDGTRVR